jgi:GH35 family endo-1,4-beta-xylanase
MAEKYFPNNELCINEYCAFWTGNARFTDPYYLYIENALLKGARIDAIGMQYHMFFRKENYFNATRKYYNFDHLYKIMDLYSNFGKPIEITEITVPAFSGAEEDELHQAEIIENLYTLWFSHDKTTQIIYWNLVDGYAHGTTPGDMANGENYYYGGLLRFDLSEKPAYKTIKKLITEVWHTDETVITKEGKASVKAFYGDYEVEITADGKTVTKTIPLLKGADRDIKIVL